MLLHTCCAPCGIHSLQYWREQGVEPVLYYFNPNIHPYEEYLKRRDTLLRFADAENVEVLVDREYPLKEYLCATLTEDERCTACYRFRLEQTAGVAAAQGHSEISTTLLISPYQQHERLIAVGEEVAGRYDLTFRYADLRPGFRASQAEARAREYYLQNYCGCLFSELDRHSRRAARKEAKDKRKTIGSSFFAQE